MEKRARGRWARCNARSFSWRALLLSVGMFAFFVKPLGRHGLLSRTILHKTLCTTLERPKSSDFILPSTESRDLSWSVQTDLDGVRGKPEMPVTLVTCYFVVKGAKHSSESYNEWMANLLSPLQTPMVIFTTPELAPAINKLRGQFSNVTKIIVDFDVWTFPSVRKHEQAYKTTQFLRDPMRAFHKPELYAIWASKPWMVLEVSKRNPFGSKYFFWIDVGSVRSKDHSYRTWPDVERVKALWKGQESRVLVGLVKVPSYEKSIKWWLNVKRKTPPLRNLVIQGTFFGATASGIQWFSNEFYRFRDYWIAQGVFVGDDQNVISSIVALNWPHVLLLDSTEAPCKDDPWFYFQYWLARVNEGISTCGRINLTLLEDEPLTYEERPELLSTFMNGMGN